MRCVNRFYFLKLCVLCILFYKSKAYLLEFVRQWLNSITYPWISAPFGEISPLGYSSLLVLLPLHDLD